MTLLEVLLSVSLLSLLFLGATGWVEEVRTTGEAVTAATAQEWEWAWLLHRLQVDLWVGDVERTSLVCDPGGQRLSIARRPMDARGAYHTFLFDPIRHELRSGPSARPLGLPLETTLWLESVDDFICHRDEDERTLTLELETRGTKWQHTFLLP